MKIKSKKSLIAVVAVCALAIGGTFAYFTTTVIFPNLFQLATYSISTTEVFDSPNDWAPGQLVPKTITSTNEGTIDAAIRISLEESWTDSTGADITSDMSGNAIINFTNQGDWIYDDGYYYYHEPLAPNGTTSSFIEGVTLNPDYNNVTCSGTGNEKVCTNTQNHYHLVITIQTAQADKYKEIWQTDFEPPQNVAYSLADIVYFDPVSNDTCNASTFNLANVNNGTSTCYKWRVIETADNTSKSDIKLQLDHNTTVGTYSGNSESNIPNSALGYIASAMSGWNKVANLNYSYDTSAYDYNYGTLSCVDGVCSANGSVVAGSSEHPIKARMITVEELNEIFRLEEQKTGCTILNSGSSTQRYFSYTELSCSNNDGGDRTLSWLIENTINPSSSDYYGSTAGEYSINYPGYWTLSPHSYSQDAASQIYNGTLTSSSANNYSGIRPVIIADKSSVVLGNAIPYDNTPSTDGDTHPVYNPGDILYFDPVSNDTCNSSTGSSTCYKWRVIETADSSDKTDITVMLDHNIVNTVSLNSHPVYGLLWEINTKMNNELSTWARVPLLNYSYDSTVNGSLLGRSYGIFDCKSGTCGVIRNNKFEQINTGARARTITPEEVDALNAYYGQSAVYNKLYNNNPGSYATIDIHNDASWLAENTNNNEYDSYNYGYWTIAVLINRNYYSESWLVDTGNGNRLRSSDGASNRGLRPVITMPKANFASN